MATCNHGHSNADAQQFCGTCGERLQPTTGRTEPGGAALTGPPPPPPRPGETDGPAPDDSGPARDEDAARRPLWRRPKVLVGAGAVLVVGVVAVLAATASGGGGQTARIMYTLTDTENFLDPSVDGEDPLSCQGTGGYDDFDAGMGIRITDGKGSTIGSGSMRNAESHEELVEYMVASGSMDDEEGAREIIDLFEETGAGCILVAEVEVRSSDFYELHLGGENRGSLTYSRDELAGKDWYFTPTLGD